MPSHRVTMQWMGQEIETLADLWPNTPRAMIVGINPSPVSVTAGHYYQGNLGKTLFRRLLAAGILRPVAGGYEDDQLFSVGIGFTDVVKRPTVGALGVEGPEFSIGRTLLLKKLDEQKIPLVIFAFKKSATTLLGDFRGNGFLSGTKLGNSEVFVMPGPYETAASATATVQTLKTYWQASYRSS